jgi:hypothetical protein
LYGLDDLIVGAYQANPSGKPNAGKSYVIFGKTDTDAVDLSKLGDESKYTIDYLGNKDDNTLTSTTTSLAYRLDRLDQHLQLNHLSHRR